MSAVIFLSVDDVLEIHRRVVEAFGGDVGPHISHPWVLIFGIFLTCEITLGIGGFL